MSGARRRAGTRLAAVAAVAVGGDVAAQALVEVHLPPTLAEVVVDALRLQLGDAASVRVGTGAATAGAVVVATEVGLQQLALGQAFARLETTASDPQLVESGGRWALPWAMPYSWLASGRVAATGRALSFATCALDGELQDRLALCAPTVDPVPWLLAMHTSLLEGGSEAAGFGLWTTLDARVGTYRSDAAAVLAAVAGGAAEVGVVPVPLVHVRGVPPGCVLRPLGRSAAIRLGLAVVAPGGPGPQALAGRLLAPGARLQLQQDLGLVSPAGTEPGFEAADVARWLAHFEERIHGRGRGVEQLADALDYAFTLLFVGVVLAVWWRQRRRPAPPASSP